MTTPDPATALQRALSALPSRPALLIPPDQAQAASEAIADLPEHVVAPLLIPSGRIAGPVLVIPVADAPYPAHRPAPEGAPRG